MVAHLRVGGAFCGEGPANLERRARQTILLSVGVRVVMGTVVLEVFRSQRDEDLHVVRWIEQSGVLLWNELNRGETDVYSTAQYI